MGEWGIFASSGIHLRIVNSGFLRLGRSNNECGFIGYFVCFWNEWGWFWCKSEDSSVQCQGGSLK